MYTALPKSGSPFGPTPTRPGLHIWRVEKLCPVPVPESSWGIFFSGDAYLVLHLGPEERAHLHLWIGRDASRDERGACALLSTQLNALLGERPVTHREAQGHESDEFMGYFPCGITYQDGGVDSAFKSVQHSPGPVQRLYQVKGRRNIRATERDLSWASFNTGDCFILDLGETIFMWCGARCNVLERSRAQELAAAIRDGKRGGKARLETVVDGEEPPEMLQVSDAMGRMDLSKVAQGCPFNQSLLCSDDCFVLDTGTGGKIYVWKGCKANEQERQAALSMAEQTITRMGYSPHTQVEILPQGNETPLFKQFFSVWK
ncbi:hypothetical protein ASZ78_003277 [Callipepla squamata]|uniref:Gelsolin-like domain-containing protein n=1 Tax=Callipepla squamata TaxID=9009 RepID=A0A226MEH6_CALSU|nr:hypothetical protein ASZ78_003277 [Callipepla squamata]